VTGEDQHRYVFDLNHVISCRELKRPVINFTQAQKDMIKSKCQYSTFVDISAVYIYSLCCFSVDASPHEDRTSGFSSQCEPR
jgi:hypothetical protein